MRSSDRRKLRQEILSLYPTLTEESLSEVLAPKEGSTPGGEELITSKILTHGGDHIILYLKASQPIFFRLGSLLFPTVYTLWKFPRLLPSLTTHGAVMKKLFNAADLMLPGVLDSLESLPVVQKGDIMSIVLNHNCIPLAVGVSMLSSKDMALSGMRGKGINTIHTYGDTLWAFGSKEEPPISIPTNIKGCFYKVHFYILIKIISISDIDEDDNEEYGSIQKLDDSVDFEFIGHDDLESRSAADYNDIVALDDMVEDMRSVTVDDCNSQSSISSPSIATSKIEEIGIETEMHSPSLRADDSIIYQDPNIELLSVPEIDLILEMALLTAISIKLPEDPKMYPIDSSQLYSKYILPCKEIGYSHVDVKQSSHKKAC